MPLSSLPQRGDLETLITLLAPWRPHFVPQGVSGSAGSPFVGFEGGHAESLESRDELSEAAVVVDPDAVLTGLVPAQPAADGLRRDLAGPVPIRPVQLRRIAVTGAVVPPTTSATFADRSRQDTAAAGDLGQLFCYLSSLGRRWRASTPEACQGGSTISVISYGISTL